MLKERSDKVRKRNVDIVNVCKVSFYERMLNKNNIATWEWDIELAKVSVDKVLKEILGLNTNSISESLWFSFISNNDVEVIKRLIDECYLEERNSLATEIAIKNNNSRALIEGELVSRNEKGEPKLMVGTLELVRRKENISDYQIFVSQSPMAIIDLKGNWEKVNSRLCEILGYSIKDQEGFNFRNIIHPDDKHLEEEIRAKLLNGLAYHPNIEKRFYNKKGELIHAVTSIALVKDSNGKPIHFLFQLINITSQLKVNNKIEIAFAEKEAIFTASSKAIILATDTNGLITEFNSGAENLLGYKKEEIVSKETPALFHCENEIIKKGIELSKLANRKIEGFNVFTEIANSSKSLTQVWTLVKKNGIRFPVQLTIDNIKNSENVIVGYLGVAIDISKIKEEEKETKELLEVTQGQNERLLNFAHIVSHNLKSHSGNFNMLLQLFKEENESYRDNEMIKMLSIASNNLTDTVSHLNEVVQMNTMVLSSLVAVNLKGALDKVIENISGIILKTEVIVENKIDNTLKALCIPAYLDSILLNFLTNSIKYRSMTRNSYVNFSTSVEEDFIVLSVQDNGLGIDLIRHKKKLFGMYKTFHDNKESRGLGLFIVKNQIESLGGKIEVTSKVNKGTVFKIYLKYEKKPKETF